VASAALRSEEIQEIPRESEKTSIAIGDNSDWRGIGLLVEYEQGLRTAVREFLRSTGDDDQPYSASA
jgi:hypothetical protein